MKWIKVEDRLPEDWSEVLARSGDDVYFLVERGNGEWLCTTKGDVWHNMNFTHWAEIEPPEED